MLCRLEDVFGKYSEAVDVLLPRRVVLAVIGHENPEFTLGVSPKKIRAYSPLVRRDLAYGQVFYGSYNVGEEDDACYQLC